MFKRVVLTLMALALPALAQEVDGRVLEDNSGEPLANAELRFHKAGMRELAADMETERDGSFHASGLPAGEYTVDVSKPNHITTTLKLQVPSTGLLVRLVRYAVIAGTVRDTEGKPLPGRVSIPTGRTSGSARIAVLVKQPGTEELKAVRQEPLGDLGTYRIFNLPPGQYAVGLWWAGLPVGSGAQMYPDNAHPRFFDVAGGEDYHDIDFLVVAGASFSVSGKVDGAAPKAQYSIALASPDLPAMPVAQAWTEEDGTFRLEKISPGAYDLLIAGPTGGYGAFESMLRDNPVFGRQRIQVIAENLEGVNVPVSAGRTVDVILHGAKESCPKTASVGLTLLEPWGLFGTQPVTSTTSHFRINRKPCARTEAGALQPVGCRPGCGLLSGESASSGPQSRRRRSRHFGTRAGRVDPWDAAGGSGERQRFRGDARRCRRVR